MSIVRSATDLHEHESGKSKCENCTGQQQAHQASRPNASIDRGSGMEGLRPDSSPLSPSALPCRAPATNTEKLFVTSQAGEKGTRQELREGKADLARNVPLVKRRHGDQHPWFGSILHGSAVVDDHSLRSPETGAQGSIDVRGR